MTNLGIHFARVDDYTQNLLDLISDDVDYDRFLTVVRSVALNNEGRVTVNEVRRLCSAQGLDFNPRRYSAFWNRATGKDGPLQNTDDWETCESTTSGRNGGKPQRIRRWVANSSATTPHPQSVVAGSSPDPSAPSVTRSG